jgi:hypothetical protein
MSGLPDYNYGAFRKATEQLRVRGYRIHSPVEVNYGEGHVPGSRPWEDYMRGSLGLLLDCDGIILLPGWVHSDGAVLEFQVAKKLKMEIFHYDPDFDTVPTHI